MAVVVETKSARHELWIDKSSWFYQNCKIQRRRKAKICDSCPFRFIIEESEEQKSTK